MLNMGVCVFFSFLLGFSFSTAIIKQAFFEASYLSIVSISTMAECMWVSYLQCLLL
jgi:hypothetical protein